MIAEKRWLFFSAVDFPFLFCRAVSTLHTVFL